MSRYGEPKPVETYKPQAYRPLVYQKVPVIEPKSHGIKEGLKAKIASTKVARVTCDKKVVFWKNGQNVALEK